MSIAISIIPETRINPKMICRTCGCPAECHSFKIGCLGSSFKACMCVAFKRYEFEDMIRELEEEGV